MSLLIQAEVYLKLFKELHQMIVVCGKRQVQDLVLSTGGVLHFNIVRLLLLPFRLLLWLHLHCWLLLYSRLCSLDGYGLMDKD